MGDISLAIEMLEQGHREEAVQELERILAEDIDQIAAWRLLANAVTNPSEIKECYEHILRINPHDMEAIEMLRSLGEEEVPADTPPFFPADLEELDQGWDSTSDSSVTVSGDTAPVELSETEMEPYPQNAPKETPPAVSSAEARLFDDEESLDDTPKQAAGSIFENDALFYTMIVVLVVFVLAVAYFAFGGTILPWLRGLLGG
jgi:hypothetical protein